MSEEDSKDKRINRRESGERTRSLDTCEEDGYPLKKKIKKEVDLEKTLTALLPKTIIQVTQENLSHQDKGPITNALSVEMWITNLSEAMETLMHRLETLETKMKFEIKPPLFRTAEDRSNKQLQAPPKSQQTAFSKDTKEKAPIYEGHENPIEPQYRGNGITTTMNRSANFLVEKKNLNNSGSPFNR